MYKVFVTGASGMVGTEICKELMQIGHTVWALVRRHEAGSELARHGVKVIVGDSLDARTWPRLLVPDTVIHLPSEPAERQYTQSDRATAVKAARTLVKRFPDAHILYASSIWVYGSAAEILTESASLAPLTGLGLTKALVEQELMRTERTTILRLGMAYPHGAFWRQLLGKAERGALLCPGAGENFTGVVALADVVRAFVTAVDQRIFGTFNWVDDTPLTWHSLCVQLQESATRSLAPVKRVPLVLIRLLKGYDTYALVSANLQVDNAKAKTAGFSLLYPRFPEGLRAYVTPNERAPRGAEVAALSRVVGI